MNTARIDAPQQARITLLTAVRNQLRGIGAAFRREIDGKLGGGSPLLFLAAMLEPVFAIGTVTVWHFSMKMMPTYGSSILLFITSGLYPHFVFVHLSSALRGLRYGARKYPLENSLDLAIGKAGLMLSINAVLGVVLFSGIYYWASTSAYPWNWACVAEALLALIVLGFGIALCNSVLETLWPYWSYVWGPVARSMILFSGVFVIPDFVMDEHVRRAMSWTPIMHAIALFRRGFYPQYPSYLLSLEYMWGCAFFFLALGLVLTRVFRQSNR